MSALNIVSNFFEWANDLAKVGENHVKEKCGRNPEDAYCIQERSFIQNFNTGLRICQMKYWQDIKNPPAVCKHPLSVLLYEDPDLLNVYETTTTNNPYPVDIYKATTDK
jgi:hypothetical protein